MSGVQRGRSIDDRSPTPIRVIAGTRLLLPEDWSTSHYAVEHETSKNGCLPRGGAGGILGRFSQYCNYTVSQKSEPPKHFATATANLHRFK